MFLQLRSIAFDKPPTDTQRDLVHGSLVHTLLDRNAQILENIGAFVIFGLVGHPRYDMEMHVRVLRRFGKLKTRYLVWLFTRLLLAAVGIGVLH